MKAVVLYGPGDVRLAEFPTPEIKPGTVKVAVSYCGICKIHLLGTLKTEVIHYGLCARTQRLKRS